MGAPRPGRHNHRQPGDLRVGLGQKGKMITGFNRQVIGRDLATTSVHYASRATGALNWSDATASTSDGDGPVWSYGVPLHEPFTRTVHYSTEGGLRWQDEFMEGPGIADIISAPTAHQPGDNNAQQWNGAVFGPSFSPTNPAYRDADLIWPLCWTLR